MFYTVHVAVPDSDLTKLSQLQIHASVLTLMGIFMLGFASYCLADSKGADALLR
jgi:hypothetical protein